MEPSGSTGGKIGSIQPPEVGQTKDYQGALRFFTEKNIFCVGVNCCVGVSIFLSCRADQELLIDGSNVEIGCVIHK